jgi:hypothetical protein
MAQDKKRKCKKRKVLTADDFKLKVVKVFPLIEDDEED